MSVATRDHNFWSAGTCGIALVGGWFDSCCRDLQRWWWRDSYYGSWTGACGPSWSCRVSHPKDVSFLVLFGALEPGEPQDRLWSRRRGSNIIKIDGWALPGPSGPSLRARHIFFFGLTLAPSWGSGLGLISGPFRSRFRDSFWSSFGAPKVSRKATRRHPES